jgi:transposase
MSLNELKRAGVLARVVAETLTLGGAAALMAVSYRQAKRLYGRYRAEGAAGLQHRSAGRASNRATAMKGRERVLALVRQKYGGSVDDRFGPTLAAEHLGTEDGVTVDHETLRRWMLAAGLWSRARKRSPHRRRRERKAHFGELVQMDGSFHPWFEDRAPASCLLTMVDDATGTSLGRFGAQETIWGAVGVLRAWIERYGIPQAIYTDWKNVYVRVANAEERATGAEPLTQFGRMCATLGIKIIPASSPQAKGRVERNHATQQDRLVKKLRRKGIADLETANAFLETAYWADHNERFAQAPTSTDDFHVARSRGLRLDLVFRLEEERTVSNDWVVRYDSRFFQLERQSGRAPARGTVVVSEAIDGQIEIRYRAKVMRWTEIVPSARHDAPSAAARSGTPARTGATRIRPRPAGADHPWRHAVENHYAARQLAADRRAWAAVEP